MSTHLSTLRSTRIQKDHDCFGPKTEAIHSMQHTKKRSHHDGSWPKSHCVHSTLLEPALDAFGCLGVDAQIIDSVLILFIPYHSFKNLSVYFL